MSLDPSLAGLALDPAAVVELAVALVRLEEHSPLEAPIAAQLKRYR